jgi:hyaluronoglucosaminidase
VREVREIRIIQGRNSVDDVDYFDHCILEYSKDGETWVALTEPMEGVYEIEWKGEPFEARYVGIRKLESKKRNWLAIRSFEINPVAEADFGWDANPFTFVKVEGSIVVDIMSGCHADNGEKSLELMLGKLGDKVEYRIYNDFADYSRGEITSSRASIELPMTDIVSGQWRIELKGNFDLYELFFK